MYQMRGTSRLLTQDERLPVVREGLRAGEDVVYVDGKPLKRAPQTFAIACHVQPLGGRDLLRVPEGDRFKEQFNVWSYATEHLTVNDRILRLGRVYNVESAEFWGRYVKARIMEVDVGPDYRDRFDVAGTEKWSLAPSSATIP